MKGWGLICVGGRVGRTSQAAGGQSENQSVASVKLNPTKKKKR